MSEQADLHSVPEMRLAEALVPIILLILLLAGAVASFGIREKGWGKC